MSRVLVLCTVAAIVAASLVVVQKRPWSGAEKGSFLSDITVDSDVTNVNIHIKVTAAEGKTAALLAFHELGKTLKQNGLNFDGTNDPHVTAYLTDFTTSRIPELAARVAAVVQKLGPCSLEMDKLVVSGAYGMWNVKRNECLQRYSDEIVLATSDLVAPSAKENIPDWVWTLPEPLRSEKLDMIHKYGSPNVFASFQPHLTLAYDTAEPLDAAFAALHVPEELSFPAEVFALGSVGIAGSVLTGKDFATIPFEQKAVVDVADK
eukprot:GILK01002131.1.p1 GENE.GILK01002131.1~~GILK01002131.1.p1  ORF type:complete len:263 (+),score=52.69 GILK01002131.1:75-863(+)